MVGGGDEFGADKRPGTPGCSQMPLGLDSDLPFTSNQPPLTLTPQNLDDLRASLETHSALADRNQKSARTSKANTIDYLVRPFIEEVLGYKFSAPTDVQRESDVGAPGKSDKVDIALLVGGERVVLIEVKRTGDGLGQKSVKQLQYYFTFVPTAKFAVLTDGIEWQWFKGEPKPEHGHLMEGEPFLVHKVLSPPGREVEWINHVSKAQFDIDRLKGLSRQIEFATKLRVWIRETFLSPTETRAGQLSEVADLGAEDDELPVVIESIRSAWIQVMRDQVGVESPDSQTDDEPQTDSRTSPDEPNPTDTDTSDASDNRLRFVSHTGDQLEIGNGETLHRDKQRRAWKVNGEEWRVEKTGTLLVTNALGLMLGCDAQRDNADALAQRFGRQLRVIEAPPSHWRWEPVPGFVNLYFDKNMTHQHKRGFLAHVAQNLMFDPSEANPLSGGTIEWWLPALNS